MFGRVQVLESKLDIYEDLSKEMLNKLENAVATISENSNRVAVVLERHENRLDEGDKANDAILSLVKRIEHNLKELEDKVDKISKFRWIATGIGFAAVFTIQIGGLLTPWISPSNMVPSSPSALNGSN